MRSVLLQNTPILCYNIQKRSAYAVFWQNISKCGRKEEQVQRERRQHRISRVFVCLKRAFKKERKGSACSIRSPRSQSLSQITTLSSSKWRSAIFSADRRSSPFSRAFWLLRSRAAFPLMLRASWALKKRRTASSFWCRIPPPCRFCRGGPHTGASCAFSATFVVRMAPVLTSTAAAS